MTIESQLRGVLTERGEQFNTDLVFGSEKIAARGRQRLRRNRVLGGVGALLLFFAVAAGVAGLRTDENAGLTVATAVDPMELQRLRDHMTPPQFVAFAGEQFVGLASVSSGAGEDGQPVLSRPALRATYFPVTSADGVSWMIDANAPVLQNASAALLPAGEHNQGEHVITALVGDEIVILRSTDYVDWKEERSSLPTDLDRPYEDLSVLGADTPQGHAILLTRLTGYSRTDEVTEGFRDRGIGAEDLCELEFNDGKVVFRVCGTDESDEFTAAPISVSLAGTDRHVLLMEDGNYQIEPRESVYTAVVESNGVAFGDSASSFDGRPVVEADGFSETPGLWFTIDGQAWERLDLPNLYADQFLPDLRLGRAVRGPNGWAVVAHHWGAVRPEEDLTEFEISQPNQTLRGAIPNGPAELRDADGSLLRSWEHFEPGNLEWSGVNLDSTGLTVVDQSGDEPLMRITHQEWADAFVPSRDPVASDVWFSPDGRSWRRIASSEAQLSMIAVGADHLVVRSYGAADVYRRDGAYRLEHPPLSESIPISDGGAVYRTVPAEREEQVAAPSFGSGSGDEPMAVSEEVDDPELSTTDGDQTNLPPASESTLVFEVHGENPDAPADEWLAQVERDAIPGTGVSTASSRRGAGAFHYVRYERVWSDGETVPCSDLVRVGDDGTLSSYGGGCTELRPPTFGGRTTSDDFSEAYLLRYATDEAAWLVVRTQSGALVAANIVDGFSYLEWPRELGEPVKVSVQDADFNEIWSE